MLIPISTLCFGDSEHRGDTVDVGLFLEVGVLTVSAVGIFTCDGLLDLPARHQPHNLEELECGVKSLGRTVSMWSLFSNHSSKWSSVLGAENG